MTNWSVVVSTAIQAFDTALGRPPFPLDAPPDLIEKANAVESILRAVVEAGRLKSLEGVADVTTTLPVLCASLTAGTPGHLPCLKLYRPVLLAAAYASTLSTYPISYLLKDAETVLDACMRGAEGGDAAVTLADDTENEVVLFTFLAVTRTLTPAHMRRFLRLPPPAECGATGAGSSKGKGKKKAPPKGGISATVSSACAGPVQTGSSNDDFRIPRALIHAIIDASLPEDSRLVFESFLDNTPKFLACVSDDGDLARRILQVYAGRLVPKLKPSSLLPCLDAALLDYFVDIVAVSLRTEPCTLLSSSEFRGVPLRLWTPEHLRRLSEGAARRSIAAADAEASLWVNIFLYRIYCEMETMYPSFFADPCATESASVESRLSEIEADLLFSVSKAVEAVLSGSVHMQAPSSSHVGSLSYAPAKTGILEVECGALPPVLAPFSTFVELLLARPASVVLWNAGLRRGGGEEQTMETFAGEKAALSMASCMQTLLESLPPHPQRNGQGVSASIASQKRGTKSGAAKAKSNLLADVSADTKGELTIANRNMSVTLSSLLSQICRCLVWTRLMLHQPQILSGDGGESCRLLSSVARAYATLLQHQPHHLKSAAWRDFTMLFTLIAWVQPPSESLSSPADNLLSVSSLSLLLTPPMTTVLEVNTSDTDSVLWLSPLVLRGQDVGAPKAADSAAMQALWSSTPRGSLGMTAVRAAIRADGMGGSAKDFSSLPLGLHLFPAREPLLLGALCGSLNAETLVEVADCLVSPEANRDDEVLVARLMGMRMVPEDTIALSRSCILCPNLSAEAAAAAIFAGAESGLQRLRDVVSAGHQRHLAVLAAARQAEAEEDQRRAQSQLPRIRALADAHRIFCEEEEKRRSAKEAERQSVKEELSRRRAARAARQRESAETVERKRQLALQTMRQRAEQCKSVRTAARQLKFAEYQRRLQSEYRVSIFLEHLQLSSARVMEVREALRPVLNSISPDDLLEYLVSGTAKVPADILDGGWEGDNSTAAPGEVSVTEPSDEDADTARFVGERRDFWAEVMDNASAAERHTSATITADASSKAAAGSPGGTDGELDCSAMCSRRSFHARAAPLLDLFCFEDGDEYGRVPNVLPSLLLSLASRVWPPPQTRRLGFADLREAFQQMQARGLVTIRERVVQLTLLGFRYHFPFHDPDGMLEVYLREAQERVKAVIEARGQTFPRDVLDDEEVVEEESSDEEKNDNEDRLLPDVEFGI